MKKNTTRGLSVRRILARGLVALALPALACCGSGERESRRAELVISTSGSDTMVNLAQMWAEEYRRVAPDVSVEVGGGGSGVGIRDLAHGVVMIANCSRRIEEAEIEQAKRETGQRPVEWIVAYDAMAIYINEKNPLESISFDELRGIYAEHGEIEKWSQLGIDMEAAGARDGIVRVSRQNSSGSYVYFRDEVLNSRDFKMGSIDMSGSKDLVALVARAPAAIGYSGMGYAAEGVKFARLSVRRGGTAHELTLENVLAGRYPLARPLMLYTLGRPEGRVKEYIDWILSPAGQAVVELAGYVPVARRER